MTVKIKAYDVKLLAKQLEVQVGRPVSNYAASTAINVILKWVEKSALISENKLDDVALALYPALIKFLSKKIDLKEFKGDFELEKAFDLKELLAQLEKNGLVVAEEAVTRVIEVSLAWVIESANLSETPYDDVIVSVIPMVLKPLNDFINGISPDVESDIDPDQTEFEV